MNQEVQIKRQFPGKTQLFISGAIGLCFVAVILFPLLGSVFYCIQDEGLAGLADFPYFFMGILFSACKYGCPAIFLLGGMVTILIYAFLDRFPSRLWASFMSGGAGIFLAVVSTFIFRLAMKTDTRPSSEAVDVFVFNPDWIYPSATATGLICGVILARVLWSNYHARREVMTDKIMSPRWILFWSILLALSSYGVFFLLWKTTTLYTEVIDL